MLKYTIHFTDGGVLPVKGAFENIDNIFSFYGEDKIIKYMIPVSQIKYIEVNQKMETALQRLECKSVTQPKLRSVHSVLYPL